MLHVQGMRVQPRVHTLARAAGTERAAAAHHNVQHAVRYEIVVRVGATLKSQHKMRQLRDRGGSKAGAG